MLSQYATSVSENVNPMEVSAAVQSKSCKIGQY